MSIEQALIKVLEGKGTELSHFLSAFPTQLLLRTKQVKGVAGNALNRVEYIGYALPDTSLSQPRWLIKKLIYDAAGFQTDFIFADGEAKFTKVFDSGLSEYAGYSYSAS